VPLGRGPLRLACLVVEARRKKLQDGIAREHGGLAELLVEAQSERVFGRASRTVRQMLPDALLAGRRKLTV
jgi:hypothetical protein